MINAELKKNIQKTSNKKLLRIFSEHKPFTVDKKDFETKEKYAYIFSELQKRKIK